MNKYPLSDIIKFQKKSHLKAGDGYSKGRFPFYTSSSNITKFYDSPQFNIPSLIFGTGGSASIHICESPFSVSTDCLVAQIKPEKSEAITIKYIYYYLFGNVWILEKGFRGAGIKHISKEYINKIEIPLLSLEDQKLIVKILDQADLLRQKRKQSIELLDEYIKSVFLEMFGDPVINSMNLNTEFLFKLAKLERGRFSPRPRNDPSYFMGEYPFIQTGDISNSDFRLKKYTQTLNEKGIKVSKQFFKGDIVIAIVGATIGATAILEIDAYATDSIICIKPKVSDINNVYLEYVLRFWRKSLLKNAPEAARPNINLAILNKLQIILPRMQDQNKFTNVFCKTEVVKHKMLVQLENLENNFQSLIQKAFKGELS